MKTIVVNIKSDKYDVYIGRAGNGQDGYFGNPFPLKKGEDRGSTLDRYRIYFETQMRYNDEFNKRIHELKGKRLGCFCKPFPCHGDIIAEYLNNIQ